MLLLAHPKDIKKKKEERYRKKKKKKGREIERMSLLLTHTLGCVNNKLTTSSLFFNHR